MSFLRSVLSRACMQYSCLVTPKNSGVLGINHFHTSLHRLTDADKSEKLHQDSPVDRQVEETSLSSESAEKAQNVKKYEMRPGYGNFPTQDDYEVLYDGVRYDELPTVHITCTRNNTKAYAIKGNQGEHTVTQKTGGSVGFKNAKKSTNVAAQTVGLTVGQIMVKRKMPHIRVVLKGHGMHRLTALKGLQLGGANIVSISDKTYLNYSDRPKKPRRI